MCACYSWYHQLWVDLAVFVVLLHCCSLNMMELLGSRICKFWNIYILKIVYSYTHKPFFAIDASKWYIWYLIILEINSVSSILCMLLILEWEMLGTTSLTFSFAHLPSYWATLASFNNLVLGNWLSKFHICWKKSWPQTIPTAKRCNAIAVSKLEIKFTVVDYGNYESSYKLVGSCGKKTHFFTSLRKWHYENLIKHEGEKESMGSDELRGKETFE